MKTVYLRTSSLAIASRAFGTRIDVFLPGIGARIGAIFGYWARACVAGRPLMASRSTPAVCAAARGDPATRHRPRLQHPALLHVLRAPSDATAPDRVAAFDHDTRVFAGKVT